MNDFSAGFIVGIVICLFLVTIFGIATVPDEDSGTLSQTTIQCDVPWGGSAVPVDVDLRYKWRRDGTVQIIWGKGVVHGAEVTKCE